MEERVIEIKFLAEMILDKREEMVRKRTSQTHGHVQRLIRFL
jgi:hypothetical protein